MPWEPEKFTAEQRYAAAKTVVHAQVSIDRLDRNEFGPQHAETVKRAYLRIDDLLTMVIETLYAQDMLADQPPGSPA